ncbi:DNA-binding response regulator [Pandoraea captiosa]|jgi:two-component system response regulator BaeR|uniref:DNA-binding response regulator n=1 Tax=Pandoraea captiosa TaxID=2508302 RepID=A0A5E5AC70_9BURK|nr:response regulator [Pandoraea captiosa]VVE70697.1 DNA-binding response regulator [Pandoraea captiosa]
MHTHSSTSSQSISPALALPSSAASGASPPVAATLPDSAPILIVEDEPKLAALLAEYLRVAGMPCRILTDGRDVLPAVRVTEPRLVLLDLMLPGMDGLEVCRAVREVSEVPIVMLTARAAETDRLLGLELGADDYICKPFSPREVVARVKAILRRVRGNAAVAGAAASSTAPPTPALVIDAVRHHARLDGHELPLTPVELRLLATLASHPDKTFPRAHLLDRMYDDHRVVADRTVDSHIKNLRRKLQAIRPDEEIVRSIYGVGYRLELRTDRPGALAARRDVAAIDNPAAAMPE